MLRFSLRFDLICLLCLAIVVAQVASDECFDGAWVSEPNHNLDVCCWYSEDTCCTNGSGFAPRLANVSNYLYNQITDDGAYASFELNQCYTYYENMFCSICSPDSYVRPAPAPITITVCQSFCDEWYNTCTSVPEVGARFAEFSISNGTELCNHLPVAAVLYETEVMNITNPHTPFAVDIATENCYSGVSSSVVGESVCTPWDGVYEDPYYSTNEEPSSGKQSSDNTEGDGDDTGDDSGYYWIFLVLAIGVVLLLVIAVIVAGFFLWKRRQAATVTSAAADFPDLDELDDYD
uniref:Folate receptor-like domain-containing protein n=1 Tax=Vannella robusta TaxID=1487602 RepID=A0A7S4HK59_9EUKA|mmetsp:Transcript_11835/g.14753  ORF Transcript_11835/g.14753 Transcript_11835/m.14753 type:complete len:292 (+) Transcript_11835:1361-2236(+)